MKFLIVFTCVFPVFLSAQSSDLDSYKRLYQNSRSEIRQLQDQIEKLQAEVRRLTELQENNAEATPKQRVESIDTTPKEALEHLPSDNRLANGAHFDELTRRKALGELTIRNGRKSDAVVKIIKNGECVYKSYIRANNEIVVRKIPNDSYTLLFAFGYGWNDESQTFLRGKEASKFDKPLTFTTTKSGGSIQYSTQSITLYTVAGGNAKTSAISDEEFDKY